MECPTLFFARYPYENGTPAPDGCAKSKGFKERSALAEKTKAGSKPERRDHP